MINFSLLIGIFCCLFVLVCILLALQYFSKNDKVSKWAGLGAVVAGIITQVYTFGCIVYIACHFISKYW